MPLVELDDIVEHLVCPRCLGGLERNDETFRCSNVGCALGEFVTVQSRWPALIDHSTSIIRPTEIESLSATKPQIFDRKVSAVRRLVRPVNEVAQDNVARLDSLLHSPTPLVLIVGGGSIGNGLDGLYDSERLRLLAFDIYPGSHVQFLADAHHIPLATATADAVIVQAVLEHVLDPSQVVAEIHRVLKPSGLVYAETPFMQQVHSGPYDFTRFTDSGHRWLFKHFDQIDRGVVAGPGTAMSWNIDHLGRSIGRSAFAGRALRAATFWVRFADRAAELRYATDAASALFFLGRRSEYELQPQEMTSEYRGAQ